jgi:hypothetical protein
VISDLLVELADAIEVWVGPVLPDPGTLPWSFDIIGIGDDVPVEFWVRTHSLSACIELRSGLILRIAALPVGRTRQ